MLSLLAKIKIKRNKEDERVPSSATEVTIGEEVINDSRENLLLLSEEADRQLSKLTMLLEDPEPSLDDQQVIHNITEEYRIKIKEMERLLTEIESFIKIDEGSTGTVIPATPIISSPNQSLLSSKQFSTPPISTIPVTPQSARFNRNGIDFEAFPQTPTLEELGLSQAALSVVGINRRRSHLSHEVSYRSSELDNGLSRGSFGSNSTTFATPRITNFDSFSSIATNPCLNTRLSDLSVDTSRKGPKSKTLNLEISSTPTVINNQIHTSPFGGVSSTIFGGRPSDTFSTGFGSEL